jgi:hypothetical protein
MSTLSPEQAEHLRRSLICRAVGRTFADRGLNSSCLGQSYILMQLFKHDNPSATPTIKYGYVEDDEYKMYWRHFWVRCDGYNYDPATICYWILYMKGAKDYGPNVRIKRPEERRIVEKLTKEYTDNDPPHIPDMQRRGLQSILQEKGLFESIRQECTRSDANRLYEIWLDLKKEWLTKTP